MPLFSISGPPAAYHLTFVGFVIQLLAGELGIQELIGGDVGLGGVGDTSAAEDVDL